MPCSSFTFGVAVSSDSVFESPQREMRLSSEPLKSSELRKYSVPPASLGPTPEDVVAGWIEAPPVRGTLVCNIGDMLDRLTGGWYRSTPHRVRNLSGRDRLSFPLFFDPDFAAPMQPLPRRAVADRGLTEARPRPERRQLVIAQRARSALGDLDESVANDEQLAEAGVKDQLRRHAGVAAAENRRVRVLSSCELREHFLLNRGEARLSAHETIVAGFQACQQFVGGEATFGVCAHE